MAPTTEAPDPDEVAIGYPAGEIEVTSGGLWVFPHLDPVAIRIDPRSMAVVEEVPLASYVTASAYGEGMLWIRTELDEQSYTRLDPGTGGVIARIPGIVGDGPLIAFGKVWIAGDDGSLITIDPATNAVQSSPIQPGPFMSTATADRIWTLGDHGLVGFDPSSGQATAPWRPLEVLGERPTFMDSSGRGTLLLATPGRLSEVDPIAHVLVGTIDAPPRSSPLTSVNAGNGLGQPPTWIFGTTGHTLSTPPRRGEALPDVLVATVDLERMAVGSPTAIPFPESHTRDGDVVWYAPLREPVVARAPIG